MEVEILTDVLVAVSAPTRQQASRVIRTPRWSTWRTPPARILVITGLLLLGSCHQANASLRPAFLTACAVTLQQHLLSLTPHQGHAITAPWLIALMQAPSSTLAAGPVAS